MALIENVRDILQSYADHGWSEVFATFEVDITIEDPSALRAHLLQERSFPAAGQRPPGFEDFSLDARRAVEAGQPSESLLFHAFASPLVRHTPSGRALSAFPTLEELEIIENFVYGVDPQTLHELTQRGQAVGNSFRVDGEPSLAVVMFAREYRNRADSVHKLQADMAYSRTGVARIGTLPHHFDAPGRSFVGSDPQQPGQRVMPCRWAPYLAVLLAADHDLTGDAHRFGPMRHQKNDEERSFWVPLHKLFDGPECIRGEDLAISIRCFHLNQKLARIHHFLIGKGIDGGWPTSALDKPPFVFTERIADISTAPGLGTGVVLPLDHPQLVEIARDHAGQPVDFKVPPPGPGIGLFASSLELRGSDPSFREVPEYVHIRHTLRPDGTIDDLNDDPRMKGRLFAANQRAVHYVDFTADGCVVASNRNGGPLLGLTHFPGYSLVAPPDFYPGCDQRELLDWHESLPDDQRKLVRWSRKPERLPEALSDDRLPPDPEFHDSHGNRVFAPNPSASLETITAVVASVKPRRSGMASTLAVGGIRPNSLPDAAAGIFAPGWDISRGQTHGNWHLASYGLGSPFPEDAKLCAALSAFWPAAAPDTTRTFLEPGLTIAPMTDEEISGATPWDGIQGPQVDMAAGTVEYPDFFFADYVVSAVKGTMTAELTGLVDAPEYERRVLTAARVRSYLRSHVRVQGFEPDLHLVSVRALDAADAEIQQAREDTGTLLSAPVDLYVLVDADTEGALTSAGNHRRKIARFSRVVRVLAHASTLLLQVDSSAWSP